MDKLPDNTIPGFKDLTQHVKDFLVKDWHYHNQNGRDSRMLVRVSDNGLLVRSLTIHNRQSLYLKKLFLMLKQIALHSGFVQWWGVRNILDAHEFATGWVLHVGSIIWMILTR
jgi:hypothetical protein